MEIIFFPSSYLPPGFTSGFQYMMTLFSMSFMVFASSAMVIGYFLENRLHQRLRAEGWKDVRSGIKGGHFDAARVSRFFVTMLYLMVVIGVMPDVLKMLAWNEVEPNTYRFLARLDVIFDALSAIPFIIGISVHIWAKQSLEHLLGWGRGDVGTVVRTIKFSRAAILWTAKLAGLLLMVAIAVTISKVAGVG